MARRKLSRTACKHKMSDHKSRSNDNSTKENEDGHDTPSNSDGGGSNDAPSPEVPEDSLTHSRSEAGLPIATATSDNTGFGNKSDEAGQDVSHEKGQERVDAPPSFEEKPYDGSESTTQDVSGPGAEDFIVLGTSNIAEDGNHSDNPGSNTSLPDNSNGAGVIPKRDGVGSPSEDTTAVVNKDGTSQAQYPRPDVNGGQEGDHPDNREGNEKHSENQRLGDGSDEANQNGSEGQGQESEEVVSSSQEKAKETNDSSSQENLPRQEGNDGQKPGFGQPEISEAGNHSDNSGSNTSLPDNSNGAEVIPPKDGVGSPSGDTTANVDKDGTSQAQNPSPDVNVGPEGDHPDNREGNENDSGKIQVDNKREDELRNDDGEIQQLQEDQVQEGEGQAQGTKARWLVVLFAAPLKIMTYPLKAMCHLWNMICYLLTIMREIICSLLNMICYLLTIMREIICYLMKIVWHLLKVILLCMFVATLLWHTWQVPLVKQYASELPWLQELIYGHEDIKLPEVNITVPDEEPEFEEASQVSPMAEDNLKQALYSVKVSMRDADAVQRGLEGELFSKWDENCRVAKARGIKIQDLDQFLDDIVEGYHLSADDRGRMNIIKHASEWTDKLIEFNYSENKHDSSVKYGMIAFGKSPNGKTVDMAYVQYAMGFKLSPERIAVQNEKSYLWGLINYKEPQDEIRRERVLSAATIKQIRNFFRFKALKGFQEEGVIDKIQYIEEGND